MKANIKSKPDVKPTTRHVKYWDCHDLTLSTNMTNNPGKFYWCKGCKTWITDKTKVCLPNFMK